jgi:hypothetical protein
MRPSLKLTGILLVLAATGACRQHGNNVMAAEDVDLAADVADNPSDASSTTGAPDHTATPPSVN